MSRLLQEKQRLEKGGNSSDTSALLAGQENGDQNDWDMAEAHHTRERAAAVTDISLTTVGVRM